MDKKSLRSHNMTRAAHLLETSGLTVMPAETIPAIAPQMQSPPGNDLQNNKGFFKPTGKKYLDDEGWIQQQHADSTKLRNATLSPVGYVDQNTNTNPYSGASVRDEEHTMHLSRAHYILSLVEWASSPSPIKLKHGILAAGVGGVGVASAKYPHYAKEIAKGVVGASDTPHSDSTSSDSDKHDLSKHVELGKHLWNTYVQDKHHGDAESAKASLWKAGTELLHRGGGT